MDPIEAAPEDLFPKDIKADTPLEDLVSGNRYRYFVYELKPEAEFQDLRIEIEAISGDPDLYVSQTIKKPNRREFTWSATSSGGEELMISWNDKNRDNKKPFYIGVRGHLQDTKFKIAVFTLHAKSSKEEDKEEKIDEFMVGKSLKSSASSAPGPNYKRCQTCSQWITDMNFARHEAFCSR